MKIGLFIPCYVDAVFPEVGIATYKLLRHLGLDVEYPEGQTCCGQPMANAGFESQAIPLAAKFEDKFKTYDYVVAAERQDGVSDGQESHGRSGIPARRGEGEPSARHVPS